MSTKLGLKDITIVPSEFSSIEHRSECNPYVNDCNLAHSRTMLPLFASPMASVVNETNYKVFNDNKINTIIPRTVDIETRIDLMTTTFVALGLNETIDIFINRNKYFDRIVNNIEKDDAQSCYICIDIANGHMKKLIDTIKILKDSYGDELIIMAGNIANPETYRHYAIAGCDYVRCGIGVGNACFVENTKIKTNKGYKNIQDICVNDYVYTHTGNCYPVLVTSAIPYTGNIIKINDNTQCTETHKFYVINKEDKNLINDDNLEKYAYWLEANKLDKNKHMIIELE